ncbi:MAG: transcriptional repressor NrdR [Thermoleophilaceae bacterium]|nr:transcriptional repressor NrdR [Thermoleophilaceae bacterium]
MRCPYCSQTSTRVVDSRLPEPGDVVRRRRECGSCGSRFTTHERAEAVALTVLKRDGRPEAFDRDKLLGGLLRAATKRPVRIEQLEGVADEIAQEVRRAGGELGAERVGELALRGLIGVDRVAAIRFASVYRRFDDLAEFEAELRRLETEPELGADQLPLHVAEAPGPGRVPSAPEGSIPSPRGPRPRRRNTQETKRRGHAEHP